jgi:hypothetical protein
MNVRTSKGMSAIILVFVILSVSLVALTWFNANTQAGSQLQDAIFDQSEVEDVDFKLQNSVAFLQNSLYTVGQHATATASDNAGRVTARPTDPLADSEGNKNRYWMCEGAVQTPSAEKTRHTVKTFAEENFNAWVNEAEGVDEEYITEVGDVSCVNVGHRENRRSPENDNFKIAAEIEGMDVTKKGSTLRRSLDTQTIENRVLYNRFYYLDQTLRDWVENQDMKDAIYEQLRQLPDVPVDGAGGPCSTHNGRIQDAVTEGLEQEVEQLEEEQFDENVDCKYDFNSKGGSDYPGYKIESSDGEQIRFEVFMDYTLTCTDTKHNNVPKERLQQQNYNIDLSYKVVEERNDQNTFNCTCIGGAAAAGGGPTDPGHADTAMCGSGAATLDLNPQSFRACDATEQTAEFCELDADLIESAE